jgi:hypothetical protein
MFSKIIRTLITILIVLVVLIAAAAEGLNWFYAFNGELCVGVGKSERLAICKSESSFKIPHVEGVPFLNDKRDIRGSSSQDLPFDEPGVAGRNLPDGSYDAMRLPFEIRLKQVHSLREAQARNKLKVSGDGPDRDVDLPEHAGLEIHGEKYQLKMTRKWSGLVRLASGQALANIALRRPGEGWTENIFLAEKEWRNVEPAVGLMYSRSETEDDARKALSAGLPGVENARWGIVDEEAVDWSQSFTPGSGADLKNGGSATLTRFDESGEIPFIEVQFVEGGKRSVVKASANERDSRARIRFEYPARLESVIMLNSFQDDSACVAAYYKGKACGVKTLASGETWIPDGFPFEIRLDQALRNAAPVKADDSSFFEAILQGPSRELRLREGEAVRCGDAILEFSRKAEAPSLRYEFVASDEKSGFSKTFSLGPGENVRMRDWRFSQGEPGADPLRMAVLEVQHSPVWSPPRILLAGSMAALTFHFIFGRVENITPPRRGRKKGAPAKRKRAPRKRMSAKASGEVESAKTDAAEPSTAPVKPRKKSSAVKRSSRRSTGT